MKSAFGVEHGDISKADKQHSDAYKALVWNKDAFGKDPQAKTNRKVMHRHMLRGQAAGFGAGGAAGAAIGAGITHDKLGAIGGAGIGAVTGQMIGDYKGRRNAMKDPRYKAK